MSKNTVLIFILIVLALVVFIVSKVNRQTDKPASKVAKTTSDSAQAPTLNREIDINDVVVDPYVYNDLTLTLEGKINDWVTKNTFTFTPIKSNFSSPGKTLPVINKDNFKLPEDTPKSDLALGEVAGIKVTGKIVIFDRAALEKEWNIDLIDNLVDRWNKSPVILVDEIEKI